MKLNMKLPVVSYETNGVFLMGLHTDSVDEDSYRRHPANFVGIQKPPYSSCIRFFTNHNIQISFSLGYYNYCREKKKGKVYLYSLFFSIFFANKFSCINLDKRFKWYSKSQKSEKKNWAILNSHKINYSCWMQSTKIVWLSNDGEDKWWEKLTAFVHRYHNPFSTQTANVSNFKHFLYTKLLLLSIGIIAIKIASHRHDENYQKDKARKKFFCFASNGDIIEQNLSSIFKTTTIIKWLDVIFVIHRLKSPIPKFFSYLIWIKKKSFRKQFRNS